MSGAEVLLPTAILAARFAAWSVVGGWALWNLYVSIMHVRVVRDKWGLTRAQKAMGYTTLAVGYLLDMVMRAGPFALIMWRLPVSVWIEVGRFRIPAIETVSALFKREALHGHGWRRERAHWWREQLLADFDLEGDHGQPGRQ